VVFDGISDAVDYQLRHAVGEERYWRLQIELHGASDDLDDASTGNLGALRRRAEDLISEQGASIDSAVAALKR
jgi:uncharacterized protein